MSSLLEIKNLKVSYKNKMIAVDDINFDIKAGEIISIVGESGSGKSTLIKSILNLLGDSGKIENGSISFADSKDLMKDISKYRGSEISMIFQDAGLSMNPIRTVRNQFVEYSRTHKNISKKEAEEIAKTWLRKLNLIDVERVLDSYPFELSGGMKQRVVLAMIMSQNPKLLLADEPTSALDVTVQAQILSLIKKLQKETELSVALVSHDFGVIAGMCDYVYIMYRGNVVEKGNVEEIFSNAQHPYTKQLLAAARLENKESELLTVDYEQNKSGYVWEKVSDTHEYLKEVE